MARYIDANNIDYTEIVVGMDEYAGYRTVAFKSDIDDIPTADVVSREELDRLHSILDYYALQYGTVKDQHEVIDRVKRETAMEIFGEIESILYSAFVPVLRADLSIEGKKLDGLHIRVDDYNTIKKKYTEGDNNG